MKTFVLLAICFMVVVLSGCGRTGPCRFANGFEVYNQGDPRFDEGGSPGSATVNVYVQYTQDGQPIEGRSIILDVGQNRSCYLNDEWHYPDGDNGVEDNNGIPWGDGERSKWCTSGMTGNGGVVTFSGTRSFGGKNGLPYWSKIGFSNPLNSSQSGQLVCVSANAKDCRTDWPYELIPWTEDGDSWCDLHNGTHWFQGGYYISSTGDYPPYRGKLQNDDGQALMSTSTEAGSLVSPLLEHYPTNSEQFLSDPNFVPPEVFHYENSSAYFCVDPNGVFVRQEIEPLPMTVNLVDTTSPCSNTLQNDEWLNNNYPDPPLFGYKEVSTTMVWQDGDMGADVVTPVPTDSPWAAGNNIEPLSVLLNSYPNRWDIAVATASPVDIPSWSSMARVWTNSLPEGKIFPITSVDSSPDGKFHVAHTDYFVTMEYNTYMAQGVFWGAEQMVYDDWSDTDDPNEVAVKDPNFLLTQWDHDNSGMCLIDPASERYDPNYTECQFKQMYNPDRIRFLPVIPVDVNDFVEVELVETTPLDRIRFISGEWLLSGAGDLNGDGITNMLDYAILVKE
jgi:hypothetical protein